MAGVEQPRYRETAMVGGEQLRNVAGEFGFWKRVEDQIDGTHSEEKEK